jgi:hypothetical protein
MTAPKKMAELVAAALGNKFPGPIPHVFRFAQSGATISGPPTSVGAVTAFPQGEVQTETPTVVSQATGPSNVLATQKNIQASSVQLV